MCCLICLLVMKVTLTVQNKYIIYLVYVYNLINSIVSVHLWTSQIINYKSLLNFQTCSACGNVGVVCCKNSGTMAPRMRAMISMIVMIMLPIKLILTLQGVRTSGAIWCWSLGRWDYCQPGIHQLIIIQQRNQVNSGKMPCSLKFLKDYS